MPDAGPFVLVNYAQSGDSWVATCADYGDACTIARAHMLDDYAVWNLAACLTTRQAAAEIGCSAVWLDKLVQQGRLPAVREGVGVRATLYLRREDLHMVPPGRGKGGKGGKRKKREVAV